MPVFIALFTQTGPTTGGVFATVAASVAQQSAAQKTVPGSAMDAPQVAATLRTIYRLPIFGLVEVILAAPDDKRQTG
jgi:hypothetical protein